MVQRLASNTFLPYLVHFYKEFGAKRGRRAPPLSESVPASTKHHHVIFIFIPFLFLIKIIFKGGKYNSHL